MPVTYRYEGIAPLSVFACHPEESDFRRKLLDEGSDTQWSVMRTLLCNRSFDSDLSVFAQDDMRVSVECFLRMTTSVVCHPEERSDEGSHTQWRKL